MIPKQEIMALAAELQLQAHVVEKDYALGWLLTGIAAHPVIGRSWVFKGGTCLENSTSRSTGSPAARLYENDAR